MSELHTKQHNAEQEFILKLQNIYESLFYFYINCTEMMWFTG